ncbi:DUF2953 domain-containing protein [Clostridium bowmanii]|uniref:DUF2953 domain-containing protein n=1 Tax=Clostridium bowmanii TaxID=132925 RepID=UPI001C0D1FAF|nr:DUF2953 domain-containing protein [Clostridium bowmanii]MBU3189175.1 DUF2953 domain-containing protein [Clostridium bowmanii]MCA1073061.1 DUF2953 domain-containing protein [Clostridium bowmanii]
MFKGIIVFLLALTIILFPIPLKITLKYSNKILVIYIYNKKLKIRNLSKSSLKSNSKTDTKAKTKENFLKSFSLDDIKLLIHKLISSKFKPTLNINTKLEYGFDDAAFVAVLFGLIHSTYSFIYLLIQNFVKVKNIDIKVKPHFEEHDINMEISSIIYSNLAKNVYILFIMIICLVNIKMMHNKSNIKKYRGGNVHG